MILIGVLKDFVGSLIMYYFQYVAYAVLLSCDLLFFVHNDQINNNNSIKMQSMFNSLKIIHYYTFLDINHLITEYILAFLNILLMQHLCKPVSPHKRDFKV